MSRVASLVLVVCAAAWLADFSNAEDEPSFKGVTASEWGRRLTSKSLDEKVLAWRSFKKVDVEAIPVLLALIDSDSDSVRDEAMAILCKYDEHVEKIASTLVHLISTGRKNHSAEHVLSCMGAGAIPAILEGLKTKNPSALNRFLWELDRRHVPLRPRLGPLLDHLRLHDGQIAVHAVCILLKIAEGPDCGPEDRIRILDAHLARAVGTRYESVCMEHLELMARDAPKSKATMEALIRVFTEEKNARLRWCAAHSLKAFGEQVAICLPVLQKTFHDENDSIRTISAELLGITGKRGLTVLVASLEDEDPEIRKAAAIGMGAVSIEKAAVAALLSKATSDKEPMVRAAAAKSMGKLDPGARGVVSVLIDLLGQDPSKAVRAAAGTALGSVKEPCAAAMNALRAALKDPKTVVRAAAKAALAKLEDKARKSPSDSNR